MNPEQVRSHCQALADAMYPVVRGNGFDMGTLSVMCVQNGNDTSTRRLIVTTESDGNHPPSALQPHIEAHGAD